ncbi:MAG: hypothetical protein OXT71_05445 [Acidobacteriota bacterium]|nr:hypothetical protein [Acidobacteriota bacterium]
MRNVLAGSIRSNEFLFDAVPAGKIDSDILLSLTNTGNRAVNLGFRLRRGADNYRVSGTSSLAAGESMDFRPDHPILAGDQLVVDRSGAAVDVDYLMSFTRESTEVPDSPTNAALVALKDMLDTHLSTGDANTNFGAAILGVRNQSLSAAQRLVHIKNALEAMRDDVSIKTAVEGVGTDLDELTAKLGEVLGADSDVVSQLEVAAASAGLLTKLEELKMAVDGFEPVRVVLPPAVAGANLEADVVTADTALTGAYQDLAGVEITPQSNAADMRIWLTLFWQGRMTYRVVRGTDEVVSEQSVDSTSGTLPVSYPVAHSPASTAAQTYKLQAKRAQAGTNASAKAGTTLYVEEIYGR